MKSKKVVCSSHLVPLPIALVALCLVVPAPAAVINFDDVADGTVINTHYAGVTFTNPIGGNIYARYGEGFAVSQSNVVSVFSTGASALPFFDARSGAVDAHFSTPVGVIRIAARPVGPVDSFLTTLTSRPYLQAFDSNGNYLGTTVYYSGPLPTNCCFDVGPPETLVIVSSSGTNNIGIARISSQQPGSNPTYGLFDNLSYDSGFYTPQIHIVGSGAVTNAPNGTSYFYGTVVAFSAVPSPGWTFVGWSGDASGTANPLHVTMTTNKTISANFALVSPTNITLYAADAGWYDTSGFHNPDSANFFAGNDGSSLPSRDWFVFNIPTLGGPVTGAKLWVDTYSISTPSGELTYELKEVTTPAATVEAGGNGLLSIYNDLGDGPVYAARTFLASQSGKFETIPLGQAVRTAITAAGGQSFTMGGSVITNLNGDTNTREYIFGGSGRGSGAVQLVVNVGGSVPTVGYFTDNDPSSTGPNAPIIAAGYTPLHIFDISTQDFSSLRILMIDESDNGSISSALAARLPAIQSWVNAGGRLVVHDRSAGIITPNPFLPGTAGSGTVRLMASDIDVIHPANTLVTAGPFGIVDNLALDGGCNSEHGYISTTNLPIGSRAILSVGGNSNQVVAFSYPLGGGYVYYAAIPIDYYLDGGVLGCAGSPMAVNGPAIYTPNVLSYMHLLNPLLRFLPSGPPVGGNIQILLANTDGTPITADRVANISIETTTDLSLPAGSWTTLNSPLVLTNGVLRVDGVSASNPTQRFFRAVESQ